MIPILEFTFETDEDVAQRRKNRGNGTIDENGNYVRDTRNEPLLTKRINKETTLLDIMEELAREDPEAVRVKEVGWTG